MTARRFVILVGDIASADQDKLSAWLKTTSHGWWHHIPYSWLVHTYDTSLTAAELRNAVRAVLPTADVLVLSIESSSNWAAFGRPSMTAWLNDSWSKESPGAKT